MRLNSNSNQTIEVDKTLLDRCVQGGQDAREQLAKYCLARVRKTVMMCNGKNASPDDIVQDVMVKVLRNIHTFNYDSKFSTWLDRITVNAVYDAYRKRSVFWRVFAASTDDKNIESASEQPGEASSVNLGAQVGSALDGARVRTEIFGALDKIKAPKRVAVVMRLAYGYTNREIAEIVGCSEETAKKRVQAGRRELVALLERSPVINESMAERSL